MKKHTLILVLTLAALLGLAVFVEQSQAQLRNQTFGPATVYPTNPAEQYKTPVLVGRVLFVWDWKTFNQVYAKSRSNTGDVWAYGAASAVVRADAEERF